jgi:hypothetical protein
MSNASEPTSIVESDAACNRPQRSAGRSVEGGLLALLGWCAVLGGLALCFGPLVSWKAGKIARGLTELGMQGDTFVIGGLTLLGVAMVRRAVESLRRESTQDDALVLEQVAADMMDVRTLVQQLHAQQANVASELAGLRQQVEWAAQSPAQSAPQPASADALFQLASSLDKLGLRFEQRLKLHHTALQDSLEELSATVEHARRNLEARWDASHPRQLEEPADTYDPNVVPASVDLIESEVESAAEELATPSLGLLDTFGDDVPSALPAAPPTNVNFDALDQATPQLCRELDHAARASRDVAAAPAPMQPMSEQELRAALEQMRRGR